jgi:lysophospholipase L1-like esterase
MTAKWSSRRWLISAALAAALIVGTELCLRLFLGLGNPPLFQSDAEIGYLMVANQEVYRAGGRIKINAFHQRAADLTSQPSAGTLRILFLGDSITFGITGIDQTQIFSELVGAALRESGRAVEVMNASAVSWGIGNELAYIRRFGTFGSKIAVLVIGTADLLQPTSTGDKVGVSASQPDRKPFSAIGELIERILVPRLLTFLGLGDSGGEVAPGDRGRQFDENMRHLTDLVASVRREGSLPLVLMMPGLPKVVQRRKQETQARETYPDLFRQRVKQLAVPFVDISAFWRGDPDVASYYTDGTHLTAAGNQAVSKAIVAGLRDSLPVAAGKRKACGGDYDDFSASHCVRIRRSASRPGEKHGQSPGLAGNPVSPPP